MKKLLVCAMLSAFCMNSDAGYTVTDSGRNKNHEQYNTLLGVNHEQYLFQTFQELEGLEELLDKAVNYATFSINKTKVIVNNKEKNASEVIKENIIPLLTNLTTALSDIVTSADPNTSYDKNISSNTPKATEALAILRNKPEVWNLIGETTRHSITTAYNRICEWQDANVGKTMPACLQKTFDALKALCAALDSIPNTPAVNTQQVATVAQPVATANTSTVASTTTSTSSTTKRKKWAK